MAGVGRANRFGVDGEGFTLREPLGGPCPERGRERLEVDRLKDGPDGDVGREGVAGEPEVLAERVGVVAKEATGGPVAVGR